MHCSISEEKKLFSNKLLIALIVPLFIEQFLAILIGIIDTAMVSVVSESAVSSISLVDSINFLFTQLFSAMGTGGAVVAAQYVGKRDPLNANNAAKQLLYVTLFISLFLTTISIFFSDFLLRLFFGVLPIKTMNYCRSYMLLSALSYPALALYNGSAALLRSSGDSRAPMFTALLMNVVNVVGNALLIYSLKLEVTGAGLSTLVSRYLGAFVLLKLLCSPAGKIHIMQPLHFQPDMSMMKRIISIGLPNGLEGSIFQIGKLLVTSIVATYGVSIIAANAVGGNIINMFNLPGIAIGMAMITVVGQCIGASDIAQAKYYTVKLMKLIYIMMGILNVILFLFAKPLVMMFQLSPEGVDAATEVLGFYAVMAALFWPTSFALPNALRAAGDTKFTMLVSVLSMWLFRIGASYLLAYSFDMKLMGVWVAMSIDWIARGICFIWRYRNGKWLRKKIV